MAAHSPVGEGRTVIVGPVRYAELCAEGRARLLDAGFTLVENESTLPWEPADMDPLLATADAAICGVEVYTGDTLAKAPNLRVIARLGVGLDNVDLAAASAGRRGHERPRRQRQRRRGARDRSDDRLLRQIPGWATTSRRGRWDRYLGTKSPARPSA